MRQESSQNNSQTLISWLEDFLARLSVLLEDNRDSMTQEELSFLRSLGFSKKKNRDIYYLKTLGVYYLTTKEELSRSSLGFSPTWGMRFNGRYLILKTTESPKTEKGCSLRDILEDDVDEKYYVSEKVAKRLLS